MNSPRYHSNCGSSPPLLNPNRFYALTRQSREGSTCAFAFFLPALPTACTNRRVSESRYPLPSPSRPLSEVYALPPVLSTKNNVRLLFPRQKSSSFRQKKHVFRTFLPSVNGIPRKKSFFYKNCFMLLSCFPIDTSPLFSYACACIPLWNKRIDWRIRNG